MSNNSYMNDDQQQQRMSKKDFEKVISMEDLASAFSDEKRTIRANKMSVATLATNLLAVIFLFIAVTTNFWYQSVESETPIAKTATRNNTLEYKFHGGLFRLCPYTKEESLVLSQEHTGDLSCHWIPLVLNRLGEHEHSPEVEAQLGMFTKSVAGKVSVSAWVFVPTLFLTTVSFSFGIYAVLKANVLLIVDAVVCILAGLGMCMGFIVFITKSSIEADHVPSNDQKVQSYKITYSYSLILAIISFCLINSSAVLYTARYSVRYDKLTLAIKTVPGFGKKLSQAMDTNTVTWVKSESTQTFAKNVTQHHPSPTDDATLMSNTIEATTALMSSFIPRYYSNDSESPSTTAATTTATRITQMYNNRGQLETMIC